MSRQHMQTYAEFMQKDWHNTYHGIIKNPNCIHCTKTKKKRTKIVSVIHSKDKTLPL